MSLISTVLGLFRTRHLSVGASEMRLPMVVLAALVFGVSPVEHRCFAQEQSPVAREATPTPPETSSAIGQTSTKPSGELPTDVPTIRYYWYQGKLVPVRVDANLESLLKLLESEQISVDTILQLLREHQSAQELQRPPVSVSSIEFNGTADEQSATLDATILLQVNDTRQPILFALGLREAHILKSSIRGPSDPIFEDKDPNQGYRWWFEAGGVYELNLKLLVPVVRSSPWRRLVLNLPTAPISSLQLEIPESTPLLKAPDEVAIESHPVEGGRTLVRANGLGNRLDLQWQPTAVTTEQQAKLDVSTRLLVRSSGASFVVEATQYVKALQGVFREFTVRLPPNSQILQVDAGERTDIRERRVDPTNPQRVTIELSNSTAETVVVKWSIRLPHEPGKRTQLEGFRVESARRQSGEIGLLAPDGASWAIADSASKLLERMNAGELRNTLGGGNIVRAYRFFDPGFSLPLELQAVKPFFDVRPLLVLYATKDELRLEARYDIQTYRGQLSELSFTWPTWRADGWKLEPVQPAGTIVTGITPDDAAENGRITLEISDKAPANFQLRLNARCPIPAADSKISLPRLLGPSTASARVAFLHAEDVDAELIPAGETAMRGVSGDEMLTSESLGFPAGLKVQQYRLQTDERIISFTVTPQPLRVVVRNHTHVELTGRRLKVRQRLIHNVSYERLNQLELQVPSDFALATRFSLQGEVLLPEWSEGAGPHERLALLTLPRPMIGEVDIEASWEQPLPEDLWSDRDAQVSIPLVSSRNGTAAANVFEFLRSAWFDVASIDPQWTLEHVDEHMSRWSADPAVTFFEGLLSPSNGDEGTKFLANRAAVQVSSDPNGVQSYDVQVRLSGTGPYLNVQLPAASDAARFSWDGAVETAADVLELPVGSRRFTLPWPSPEESATEHLLRIEYVVSGEFPFGVSSVIETQPPRFPQCRWATRVIWSISVPDDQHLFSPPDNVSPLFEWQRQGLVWRRVPIVTTTEIRDWLSEEPGGHSALDASEASNTYVFSQVGTLEQLRFRMLSSAATFLLGASLTLTLGFLIIKVRALRSVIAVLCFCVALMTFALWFLPQLELLLQPMLVGIGLSALLGLQEVWQRRRTAGTILTLAATPSDWRPPAGDVIATPSLLVRSQDSATVFRDPHPEEPQSRHKVESHAG